MENTEYDWLVIGSGFGGSVHPDHHAILDGWSVATLLAEEAVMGIRFAYGLEPQKLPGIEMTGTSAPGPGYLNGPIDDIQLRSWGIQLVDGRMPGFAAIVGCARSNEVAVKIVRELQRRNILTFLCGNVNGRSIIHQLQEQGWVRARRLTVLRQREDAQRHPLDAFLGHVGCRGGNFARLLGVLVGRGILLVVHIDRVALVVDVCAIVVVDRLSAYAACNPTSHGACARPCPPGPPWPTRRRCFAAGPENGKAAMCVL